MRHIFWDIQSTSMVMIGLFAGGLLLVSKLFRRWLFKTSHRRGLVSDALLCHLSLVTSVLTALISAAIVALVFAHIQVRGTLLSGEVDNAMVDQIVRNFNPGWTIVISGVGGLLYVAGAFALNALAVCPAPHASTAHSEMRWTDRLRVAIARWCAMSAGFSVVVAVWNVPKLLQVLLNFMVFPAEI